jgi:hypothetical protein
VAIFKAVLEQHPLRGLECSTADYQVDGARQDGRGGGRGLL